MKHGKGVFMFANGERYSGDFKDNRIHGKGFIRRLKGNINRG